MAGVYGPINSRADFYRVLGEAIATADKHVAAAPGLVFGEIRRQLEVMRAVTATGNEPTDADKDGVSVGTIAVRELSEGNPGDFALDDWIDQLTGLSAYFEGWPDDAAAASGGDSELDRVGLQRAMRRYAPKA